MDKVQKDALIAEIEGLMAAFKRSHTHDEEIGLTRSEQFALFIIAELSNKQPVMSSEIAKRLGVTMAAVTHHINSLFENGYVERSASADDRRVVFIGITKKGLAVVKDFKEKKRAMLSGLIEYLGDKDSREMIALFKKITNYIISKRGLLE
jgi:DNA-binding MarR family transcriptional regulator